jgi:hypothetical protein
MSSSSAPFAAAASASRPSSSLSFARRRLRLGISGVGSSVLFALALTVAVWRDWLPIDAGWRVTGGEAGEPLSAFALTLMVFWLHALLLLPVEHAGGRRAVRHVPGVGAWFGAWLRGALVLSLLAAASVAVVVAAGFAGGTRAAVMATAGLALLLLSAQGVVARLVSRLRLQPPSRELADEARQAGIDAADVRVVAADDEAFVGGWVGALRPKLWIPLRWTDNDVRALRIVQWQRRAAQRRSGARMRGWWAAVLWPTLALWLTMSLVPFGWNDARLWLVLPAASTLWSFVAVLLLPSRSRPAVYHADAEAARVLGVDTTARAMAQLDAWQDDEPERSELVETIFHPVPAVGNRQRRLREDVAAPNLGGHQQTRLTLLSSLVTGSMLGRAVHCNIGRPSLWVVYPGD